MFWLVSGVLLWSLLHLSKCLTPGLRGQLLDRLGENAYKGLFSALIIIALVLIVLGWRDTSPLPVYAPPHWGQLTAMILMVLAMILFVASSLPGNLKRFLRHPQMTAVIFWAVAHLLSNGDSRSIILFGGLALWAIAEIVLINRRDGAWVKPAVSPLWQDLLTVTLGIGIYALLIWLHPYLSGVALALP